MKQNNPQSKFKNPNCGDPKSSKVLIIDDDINQCKILKRLIERLDHHVVVSNTLKDGLEMVTAQPFDVVFLDVRLPDGNGLDALPTIRSAPSKPEIVIITGFGNTKDAEIAIKNGAWDYLQKPLEPQKIIEPIKQVLAYRKDQQQSAVTPKELNLEGIVGAGKKIKECIAVLEQAVETHANVLIYGATGTGKEIFARAIHLNSARAQNNFVVVDCAAIPENLIESMLFGYQKGAFTGADQTQEGLVLQAHNGTLFLDEVGELSLSLQKSFLRVLQERSFRPIGSKHEVKSDFRLVAATNRDLEKMVQEGNFREDFLFRLKTFVIELPPLKDRSEDIKELVFFHMQQICEKNNMSEKGLSADFLDTMTAYDWPGNVRELVSTLERALSKASNEPTLFSKHLPDHIRTKTIQKGLKTKPAVQLSTSANADRAHLVNFTQFKESMEHQYVKNLIEYTKGNIKAACQISGLSRSRLYHFMKKYNISRYGWD